MIFETATETDLPDLLALIADDQLGQNRDDASLPRGGAWRGLIEAVRIKQDLRGRGLGHTLIAHAIGLCRDKGCALVQLTSDKSRVDAHRFYAKLGFVNSHEGYKLSL